MSPWTRITCALVLCLHAGLLAWMAKKDSPTFDELGHLPAGLSHWEFGAFDLYSVNPPLVRMVAALPVLATDAEPYWTTYYAAPGRRPEFGLGLGFIAVNKERGFDYFTYARWACIPFSLLGAWLCFRWARELYGNAAGLLALSLWCFCPNVLGHGHLITPDVGAASLGVAAGYTFWRWLKEPTWKRALVAGAVLGLCQLTKTTWIILFALWPLLYVAYHGRGRRQWKQLGVILLLAWYVLNLGYGFEGTFTPLGEFKFITKEFGGTEDGKPGNRYYGSVLGEVPVPLPKNYVLGIDYQKRHFEMELWSYLGGEWKQGGWWYYYLYALAVKAPLGILGLVLLAGLLTRRYSAGWRDELMLVAPALAILLVVSSQTGFNHHLRYVLPAFPFAFIWASKLGKAFELRDWITAATTVVVGGATVVSSLSVFPHSLSYFNELVGGPKGGHRHLSNSNTDWGQDLLYLKQWYDNHPEARPLGVFYGNIIDPRIIGIEGVPIPKAPLEGTVVCASCGDQSTYLKVGPQPGWFVIGVNRIHERTNEYAYFREFEPVDWIGYTLPVYHITVEEANRVRRKLGLPELPQ